MSLNTFSEDYLKAFVGVCVDHGLSEETTEILAKKAQEEELLENDPYYQKGFYETLEKVAGLGSPVRNYASPTANPRPIWESPVGVSTDLGQPLPGSGGMFSQALEALKRFQGRFTQ
jgi:hypothetical protein